MERNDQGINDMSYICGLGFRDRGTRCWDAAPVRVRGHSGREGDRGEVEPYDSG